MPVAEPLLQFLTQVITMGSLHLVFLTAGPAGAVVRLLRSQSNVSLSTRAMRCRAMVLRRGDGLRKETTVATPPRALPMSAMIGLICCGLLCTWAVYLISTSCGHG